LVFALKKSQLGHNIRTLLDLAFLKIEYISNILKGAVRHFIISFQVGRWCELYYELLFCKFL